MLTEISVAPDGRVFVFGASFGVLEALSAIGLGGEPLAARVALLRQNSAAASNASSAPASRQQPAEFQHISRNST